jgi:ferredoxin--NADP+ reductase
MASPSWGEDGQGTVIATTVKRLIDEYHPQRKSDDRDDHALFLGVCSNYLCNLSLGAPVQLSGPAGKRFVLPKDAASHDYLFMATGTGIAPYRGMIKEILEHPDGPAASQIHLIMGAPYRTDLLYHNEFNELSERHDNFHYHQAISREITPDGSRGRYIPRYLADEVKTFRPFLESPRTLAYMCGVMGMESGFFQMLHEHGLADPFITIDESLTSKPMDQWDHKEMKRGIKHTDRCMVEVY